MFYEKNNHLLPASDIRMLCAYFSPEVGERGLIFLKVFLHLLHQFTLLLPETLVTHFMIHIILKYGFPDNLIPPNYM